MAYPSVTKLRKLLKQHGFALKTCQKMGHDGVSYIWAPITHVETGYEWGRSYFDDVGKPVPERRVQLARIVDENLALFNDALGDLRRDIRVLGDLRELTEGGNARTLKKGG